MLKNIKKQKKIWWFRSVFVSLWHINNQLEKSGKMENSKKRIEAWQNGEAKMYDVGHFAEEHKVEVSKMKDIIREVLGIYGFVEFRTVEK